MNSASNTTGADSGSTVITSKWPHHEQLTHLAVHTPVQAHRNAEGVSSMPTDFPAHSFPQQQQQNTATTTNPTAFSAYQQELYRRLSYASQANNNGLRVQQTANSPTSGIVNNNYDTSKIVLLADNNNDTKMEEPIEEEVEDAPMEEDVQEEVQGEVQETRATPIKQELTTNSGHPVNDAWNATIAAINMRPTNSTNSDQRPHSALNSAELNHSIQNNGRSTLIAHHPLLSPGPLQPSRLSWLAENKPNGEILQPLPLKPERSPSVSSSNGGGVHVVASTNDTDNSTSPLITNGAAPITNNNGASGRSGGTLNDEETARLLLTLSQNFAVTPPTNNNHNQSLSPNQSAGILGENEQVSPTSAQPTSRSGGANNQKSRTFFRPPGHKGSSTQSTDANGLICEICGFGCSSRFHYNSHMNTHGCHQCSICNYRSRTEGRLKKHLQESHTPQQRRDIAIAQGTEPSASDSAIEQPPISENSGEGQTQRLPGTLEQIRALADNSIGFVNEQSSSSAGAMGPPTEQSQPKRSGGKPKKYVCKQCGEISTTKEASWRHNKTHIPLEKQLACSECDFVTEYKHHLQYHIRNHYGSKPFKCTKCEYTCVNKSMLNSHMKSHTPVYQFRCQDCTYQTKYCHSLKMHTYKYNHRRVQGQVYSVGEENGESIDELMEGMETESMKNYDIPEEDVEALERYNQRQRELEQTGAAANQHLLEQRSQAQLAANTSAAAPPTQLSLLNPQAPNVSAAAPQLSSLLLQPIANNSALPANHLQHLLLQQQRIGHVQRMLQNANNLIPRHKCDVCEFNTTSQEEMLTHKINHFMFNQHQQQQNQSAANALHLYSQRLAAAAGGSLLLQQSHQQTNNNNVNTTTFQDLNVQLRLQQQHHNGHPIAVGNKPDLPPITQTHHETNKPQNSRVHTETPEPSGHTTTTTNASTPRVVGEVYTEEHMSGSSELHEEAGTSSSPSDSHKSMDAASSSSPHSASSAPHTGAKRRKARKLDEISQRLQDKCSPDNVDERLATANNNKIENSAAKTNGVSTNLAQPIPSLAPLNGLANGTANTSQDNSTFAQYNNAEARRGDLLHMPYTCQHCMIAYHDQALFQIHLGYHGFGSPFKCNRCGYTADSALSFNLHLYQEKH